MELENVETLVLINGIYPGQSLETGNGHRLDDFEDSDSEPVGKIDVQAALQQNRPDFLASSEERRRAIQQMTYLRQVRNCLDVIVPNFH